jgi:UDP-N-acetylmuramyl pentapeptide phosphotransferase/UDP-N-acetylglucosamine-1-phosphate transferase
VAGTIVIAALVAAALLPPVIWALRRTLVLDIPGDRSSHDRPVPRGGGLAVAAAVAVAVAVSGKASARLTVPLAIVALIAGGLGLADDLRGGVSVRYRLALASLAGAAGAAIMLAEHDRSAGLSVLLAVPLALGIVAMINAFNFMDGINGISAIHLAVTGGFGWVVGNHVHAPELATIGAAILGGAIGFLPFNVVSPRVFLGDVGSYAAGATIAMLVLGLVLEGAPLDQASFFLLPYLADTGLTILRRTRARERVTEAHRSHAYQRLTDLGFGHATVAIAVGITSVTCGALGYLAHGQAWPARLLLDGLAVAVAVAYYASPAILARKAGTGDGS